MPLRFESGAEAAKFLRVVIELEGAEGAEEALKALEEAGTHAAEEIDREWAKVGQRMEELSGKVAQVGGVITQNVTLPIMALGAAATAMAFNVLQSEEAIAKLSTEGQKSARALQTAVAGMKGEFEELKSTVSESVMPTLTLLIEDVLIPLLETVGDLAEAWGNQSQAAKNSQLAMLGIAAAVGPVMQSLGQIGQSVGASIIIWDALKKSVIAAKIAQITPAAAFAGGAVAAVGGTMLAILGVEGYETYQAAQRGEFGWEYQSDLARGTYTGRGTDIGGRGAEFLFGGPPTGDAGPRPEPMVGPPAPGRLGRHLERMAELRREEIAAMVGAVGGGGGGGGAVAPTTGIFGADLSFTQPGGGAPFAGISYQEASSGWGVAAPGAARAALRARLGPGIDRLRPFEFDPDYTRDPSGSQWYDNLMSNDFLMMGGGQLAGAMAGGQSGSQALLGLLPMIGGAVGGAPGAIAGSLIGGLLGRGKQRGDTPQNPLHVKVINPGDLATAMLNITKTLLGQVGAVGLDKLVQQVHDQSLARNLT